MHQQPPRWAVQFLKKLLDSRMQRAVLGDLYEQFNIDLGKRGPGYARRQFLFSSLKYLRFSRLWRKFQFIRPNYLSAMFIYQLKLAFRHVRKNVLFSSISALGTALSLIGVILIGYYLNKEYSYDQFFSNKERIYRVNPVYHGETNNRPMPSAAPALAPLLSDQSAGIEKVARYYQSDINNVIGHDEINFVESRVFYADSTFLEILDYPFVAGDRRLALDEPNSVVLSRDHAIKYFGRLDVVGQSLYFNQDRLLKVTGVIDIPENSHLDMSIIMSFSTFEVPFGYTDDLTSWRWNSFFTYVQLAEKVDPRQVENHIKKVWMENQTGDREVSISLQPVPDIYLGSDYVYHPYFANHFKTGDASSLLGLLGAVVLILFIAGFNLMNLSSASLSKRREGLEMARILGSHPMTLFLRILLESFLLSFAGLSLALLIVYGFSDQFSALIGYQINLFDESATPLLLAIFAITCLYTLLSLLIPCMKTIRDLRKPDNQLFNVRTDRGLLSSRSLIMIFQLVITAVLLTATVLVREQLIYISEKDLGFDQELVIVAEMQGELLEDNYELIQQTMLANAHVTGISRSKYALNGKSGGSPLKLATQDNSESFGVAVYESYYDFLEVMKIKILAGRSFSQDFPTDSAQSIILNREAVRLLGLEVDNAVGQQVQLLDWSKTIIGVVDDFHFASLHGAVRPLAMVLPFTHSAKVLIRMGPGNLAENIKSIENDWYAAVPDVPFDFQFLDSSINQLYAEDEQFSQLISAFAIVAIIVAIMGLYGVSGLIMQMRVRETAIRKVLGASYRQVLLILSKQFFWQLLISVLISLPLSVLLVKQWLQGFSYATNLGVAPVLLALLVIVILGAIIILNQSSKVALLNPTKHLRSE